jgi:hypothetical protein
MTPHERRLVVTQATELDSILALWAHAAHELLARPSLSATAREIIECQQMLCSEIRGPRGPLPEVRVASCDRTPHGLAIVERLDRSLFIHYLVSAPWNALTRADLPDFRTTRGTCRALIADAMQLSHARGLGGRISLEAINPRCRAVYEHLEFERKSFDQLAGIVPEKLYPPAERGSHCWMVHEPAQLKEAA